MVIGCLNGQRITPGTIPFAHWLYQQVLHPPFSVNWCYIICIICKTILTYISDDIYKFLNNFCDFRQSLCCRSGKAGNTAAISRGIISILRLFFHLFSYKIELYH